MCELLLGFPVKPRTLRTVAGRLIENFTTLLLCIDGALDACHRSYSLDLGEIGSQALLPSSFLALAASPGARTLSPSRRRVRVLGLCSFKCILPAWRCMSLPAPVNLNRFLAPECVFIFGMFDPFLLYVVLCYGGAVGPCLAQINVGIEIVRGSPTPLRCRLSGSLRPTTRLLGSLRLRIGEPLGSPAIPLGLDLGTGLGLLLKWTENHQHVPTVLLRGRLDEPVLVDVGSQLLQKVIAQLGSGLLTSSEHDRDLDLVARFEEADDVTLLGLVVVGVDLGPKLHFLDHCVGLMTSALACLLGVLVLELAVVHELGDWRSCHRRDLYQIQLGLSRKTQRVLDAYDADLLPRRSDKADFGDANSIVDSRFGADMSSSWL